MSAETTAIAIADDTMFMRAVLQRIATGPHLSKDISAADAERATTLLLNNELDPVQAALFLMALRLKGESPAELQGVMTALSADIDPLRPAVEELVVLADAYAGVSRSLPLSLFVAATVAACGVPVLLHGALAMGPKFGLTNPQVMQLADASFAVDDRQPADILKAAAEQLAAKDCGWACLTQADFAPRLAALSGLREQIVKRPCLSTLECALLPARGRRSTHLVTGYVHKNYPDVYCRAALQAGFDSVAVVRGVEGSVVPSVSQPSRYFHARVVDHEAVEPRRIELDPASLGFSHRERAPEPAVAFAEVSADDAETFADWRERRLATNRDNAEILLARARCALDGEEGLLRDAIRYGAALVLASRQGEQPRACIQTVDKALDSGSALAHFEAGCPDSGCPDPGCPDSGCPD